MKNRLVLFVALFLAALAHGQDVEEIRMQYPKAVENAEVTENLNTILSNVNTSSKPVLVAYKGAILTLKAKFAKKKSEKKEYFKEGVSLIESALKRDPSNVEIHYIRLTVQENSPKFLGYHKDIAEDKESILKNFESIASSVLKEIIKDYVGKSKNFNELEKEL